MTMKRIFPVALGLAILAFASVQGYAFMLASTEVATPEGQFDVQKLVSDLTKEFQSMTGEAKLASLQNAMNQIDGVLDQGVANEAELLEARETLVAMQQEFGFFQPIQMGTPIMGTPNPGEPIVDGGILPGTVIDGGFSTGGGFSSGGFSTGGGGFGGSGSGSVGLGSGGSFGLLGAGGFAAAIAIPVATSNRSNPGNVATVVAN